MYREVCEEVLDLARAERPGIPAAMKTDIALQPLEVGLLRTQGELARAHALARQGEKSCASLQVSLRHGRQTLHPAMHGSKSRRADRAAKATCSPGFIGPGCILRIAAVMHIGTEPNK